MPDVIADTSPIQYLHQVQLLELLFTLYEEISISEAVEKELAEGRNFGVDLPDVRRMSRFHVRGAPLKQPLQFPRSLGEGEREVLAMASASSDSLLIIDDALARLHARQLGLRFTGTLGVLLKAKASNLLVAVRPILDQLEAKGFRLDKKTRAAVLNLALEEDNED